MNNTEELKNQIHSLSDEDLLIMIEEKAQDYTEEAIKFSEEEVKRRGGIEALKKGLEIRGKSRQDKQDEKKHSQDSMYRKLLAFFISLLPHKNRYENYPTLHVISVVFRVIALITAVVGALSIIFAIFNCLTGSFDIGIFLLYFFLYISIVSVALFAVSEILQVLVDIERNTKQSNKYLKEIRDEK